MSTDVDSQDSGDETGRSLPEVPATAAEQ